MENTMTIRILLMGRFLSSLADQFLLFAIPLIVYKITGSASLSGLAFAIEWLPRVISLPIAGFFSDKFGSKRVFLTADFVRAITCAVTFLLLILIHKNLNSQHFQFIIIVTMSAILAFFYAQGFIALEATLPRILPKSDLPKAQSIFQGIDQISSIGGPIAASFLSLYFNPEYLIAIASLMFLISFSANVFLPISELNQNQKNDKLDQTFLKNIKIGFTHIVTIPQLIPLIAYTILVNLIYGTARALGAPITNGTFAMPDQYYGFLNSLSGFITIIFLFLVPKFIKKFGIFKLAFISIALFILSATGIGLASQFWFFAVSFGILNGADAAFNVYIRTERAKVIPTQDLGKTIGLIVCLNQLSIPLSGMLISHFTPFMSPQKLLLNISFIVTFLILCFYIFKIYFQTKKQINDKTALATET